MQKNDLKQFLKDQEIELLGRITKKNLFRSLSCEGEHFGVSKKINQSQYLVTLKYVQQFEKNN